MPHYHKTISHDRFISAINSIRCQSFRDWELLILHDGPIDDSILQDYVKKIIEDPRISFTEKAERRGDWGHSLRNEGIKKSSGEYILNINSDNVLYQNALAILYAYSKWDKKFARFKNNINGSLIEYIINPDCLVFAVKMMGSLNFGNEKSMIRQRGQESEFQLLLSGWPPNKYFVDAMQLVAKREIWEDAGFWKLNYEEADGDLIEMITRKNGYLLVPEILGEHW